MQETMGEAGYVRLFLPPSIDFVSAVGFELIFSVSFSISGCLS
jgi:hypothetical protein